MKKTISILFALALVLSFSLVTTTAVAAQDIYYVATGGNDGTGDGSAGSPWGTIQHAIDHGSVQPGDIIEVSAGTYAGAAVNKGVTIQAKAGDVVIINDGPLHPAGFLRVGFWFVGYTGSGATIRGFHFQGTNQAGYVEDGKLDFAIFSRGANNVIVEQNTMTNTLQAITSWHGNGWRIRNNQITNLWTLNGGGTGILVGANGGSTVTDNIISGNEISGTLSVYLADGGGYDGSGIVLFADFRYGPGGIVTNSLVTGNEISMTSDTPGTVNFNGIELVDTRDSDANPAAVLNNQVVCNSVYSNGRIGIYVSAGTSGNGINFNSIYSNPEYGVRYDGTGNLDAENNWWGDDSGPTHSSNIGGSGDAVSDNVDFTPWIKKSVETVTGTGTASFAPSDGAIVDLMAVAAPSLPSVSFPHGMFSFKIMGITPGQTVDVTITLPSAVPMGTVWWKYDNGRWHSLPNLSDNGDHIMVIRPTDGGTGDLDGVANGIITSNQGAGNPMTVGWDGSPTSRAGVLAPWIALLAAMVAGVSPLVWRRRRSEV